MAHFISSFSYYPMVLAESGPAEAPDVAPERSPEETDVWLTEWQIAEERLDVTVGDVIAWALVPMDQTWAKHLFGDRRPVHLQLDTYGAATWNESYPEWTHLAGQVVRIDQVSIPTSGGTLDPSQFRLGAGVEHQVSGLRVRRAHAGEVVGWVIRVRS